ncbi:TPA: hypothetical protein ONA53_001857 [Pseudomonas aeruginosa]|uniref:ADP-ribosyltransferase-containing protein n=1 Tax=Pseudomonas aeruginosa TaxID=287 RepID=UPI000FF70EA3|nr:hypothetical protein [Pseudomonas aeruginosa]RPS20644.1 hypothetical protein IPC1027_21605 [Pseudomonas aeruginosa]HCR1517458.1 hypothetical protein [Pseudomonas aeruginosa]
MFPKQKHFYRGTKARTTKFQPASRGTFGSGLYFGDQACADEYAGPGGSVWEVKLNMGNPLHCLASLDHDYDLDSPAVPLIEQIFSEETAIELIAWAIETDGYFGVEIQQRLEQLGHDGLVATYPDGSYEVVVFSPAQVQDVRRLDSRAA